MLGPDEEIPVTRGKVSLVDLAGSERLKATQSTGKVLQEAGFINRLLYVLGKVIAGLVPRKVITPIKRMFLIVIALHHDTGKTFQAFINDDNIGIYR